MLVQQAKQQQLLAALQEAHEQGVGVGAQPHEVAVPAQRLRGGAGGQGLRGRGPLQVPQLLGATPGARPCRVLQEALGVLGGEGAGLRRRAAGHEVDVGVHKGGVEEALQLGLRQGWEAGGRGGWLVEWVGELGVGGPGRDTRVRVECSACQHATQPARSGSTRGIAAPPHPQPPSAHLVQIQRAVHPGRQPLKALDIGSGVTLCRGLKHQVLNHTAVHVQPVLQRHLLLLLLRAFAAALLDLKLQHLPGLDESAGQAAEWGEGPCWVGSETPWREGRAAAKAECHRAGAGRRPPHLRFFRYCSTSRSMSASRKVLAADIVKAGW